MEPEERAVAGLFMSFQTPVEIPGVSNIDFLNMAYNARRIKHGQPELGPIEVCNSMLLWLALFSTKLVMHCFRCIVNVKGVFGWGIYGWQIHCCYSLLQFYGYIAPKLELVNMKVDFLNRNVNVGFSGGERKRNEILQLAVWFSIFVIFSFHIFFKFIAGLIGYHGILSA